MSIVKEFIHYMDTTYPKGVDRLKYTDLKYTNNEKVDTFLREHPRYDKTLLVKVAVKELLDQSNVDIEMKLDQYMEDNNDETGITKN